MTIPMFQLTLMPFPLCLWRAPDRAQPTTSPLWKSQTQKIRTQLWQSWKTAPLVFLLAILKKQPGHRWFRWFEMAYLTNATKTVILSTIHSFQNLWAQVTPHMTTQIMSTRQLHFRLLRKVLSFWKMTTIFFHLPRTQMLQLPDRYRMHVSKPLMRLDGLQIWKMQVFQSAAVWWPLQEKILLQWLPTAILLCWKLPRMENMWWLTKTEYLPLLRTLPMRHPNSRHIPGDRATATAINV